MSKYRKAACSNCANGTIVLRKCRVGSLAEYVLYIPYSIHIWHTDIQGDNGTRSLLARQIIKRRLATETGRWVICKCQHQDRVESSRVALSRLQRAAELVQRFRFSSVQFQFSAVFNESFSISCCVI